MAAITTVPCRLGLTVLRNATAQATTGQTDWVWTPPGAKYCTAFFNLTALAGTTRVATPSFLVADPVTQVDTTVINLAEHASFTGITAINQYMFQIGPGVTGIADDVTNSATADSYVSLNCVLPPLLGFKLLLDRADGDETYTYTYMVNFSK